MEGMIKIRGKNTGTSAEGVLFLTEKKIKIFL